MGCPAAAMTAPPQILEEQPQICALSVMRNSFAWELFQEKQTPPPSV
ncbi:hypothetical protein AR1Y2_0157 [Anaerostipes rhamnosivorans]|uniref:Uncharacterized protein n=1 Tax=Anaerostipes rhamnosivorans TaxID=1229621 RepID=A0A4P8IAN8_9FIRM|nr:hypothetical protein AR1Y2_0157 [Anaerostipes rhamnosivorans]